MLKNKFFISTSFLFVIACTPELQETSINISSISHKSDTVVTVKNESYIEPSAKKASYSGSFKKLSDNPEISRVMDKVIGFANSSVPPQDFSNAYSVPSVFEIPQQNRALFTDYKTEQTNVFTMVESIRRVDPGEDLSVEAIRKDKDNPDFFSFGINSKIDNVTTESNLDFFGSSDIMGSN